MKTLIDSWLANAEGNSVQRLAEQKMRVVQTISREQKPLTIPEISRELKITAPTCIKLVNQLKEEGILAELGKKETANGRKPSLFGLNHANFQLVGVEILMKRVSFALLDAGLSATYYRQKTDFQLENTNDCLSGVVAFIDECLRNGQFDKGRIIGMGIGITGRVNRLRGESLTFFNFLSKPLGEYLSNCFHMPVVVNNDTRCYGLAEKITGKAKNARHAIVINLSRGLGTSIIVGNEIVEGSSGFAGEFGHMKMGSNNALCICGKTGCLGNEVSGHALEGAYRQAIEQKTGRNFADNIRYDEILQLALNGDHTATKLIEMLGENLGKALGNMLNLLNPELIVIGGKFVRVRHILEGPVLRGMESTALQNALKTCELDFSDMGELAGLKGAGSLVFEQFDMI